MDIQLGCFQGFKGHGTDITIRTMVVGAIVVNFNVFEHGVAHLFKSGETLAMDGFHLHSAKETFSTGIVIAVW